MINAAMRLYNFFSIGEPNSYGQPQMPAKDATPDGQVKMAINTISEAAAANVRYKEASYIGLTHADIDDTYIIQYGDERLKVLYVNTAGRYKQVFLGLIL
jgi:hypothetical protein